MKRKFKLFATVASLCLSVALMAFGVYAATTVTYTVSGSVSFSANVYCKWDVTATYGDGSEAATAGTKTFNATDPEGSSDSWSPEEAMQFGSETDHDTIKITVKCTNLGAQAITIGLGDGLALPAETDLTVVYSDGTVGHETASSYTTDYTATVGATGSGSDVYTFTMTMTLKDLTKGLSPVSFTLPFTASGTSV